MAVVLKLPAIFVFENNQYGEGTGVAYAVGSHDIAGRARGFGLPAVKVDGDDFFAVHEAAWEAVERARSGGGPSRDRGRYLPLLRPPFGRRAALPRQGRSEAAARGARLPPAFPPPGQRGGAPGGERELDAVDSEVAALIDRAVATRARPRRCRRKARC